MGMKSISDVRRYVTKYGSGYYFNVDMQGNVIDCFSIAIVRGLADIMFQVPGSNRIYLIEDLPYFIRYNHMFVHISQVHIHAQFGTETP